MDTGILIGICVAALVAGLLLLLAARLIPLSQRCTKHDDIITHRILPVSGKPLLPYSPTVFSVLQSRLL